VGWNRWACYVAAMNIQGILNCWEKCMILLLSCEKYIGHTDLWEKFLTLLRICQEYKGHTKLWGKMDEYIITWLPWMYRAYQIVSRNEWICYVANMNMKGIRNFGEKCMILLLSCQKYIGHTELWGEIYDSVAYLPRIYRAY
jgi:hypothetical protein